MTRIISIHSFRGGTGKSNLTANLASLLAIQGCRVGIIDTDIQSPGIHVLFGLHAETITSSLNDYLWRGREIKDTAQDVSAQLGPGAQGKAYLIPSSLKPGEITRVLREGYDAQRMAQGFRRLADDLQLDFLFIDTHPGLNEETLLSLVMSHVLIVVMRPDQQDYEGTGVTIKIAQELKVPKLWLVVNNTPTSLELDAVRDRVSEAFKCDVAAVMPHSEELMNLASSGLFVVRYPGHKLTGLYAQIIEKLKEENGR
jgi:septum site-determining protein MinD